VHNYSYSTTYESVNYLLFM